ncbi:TonB-dependent receptor [Pseudoduganella violaceinigra]|uniref:TonB-dependent receptor n=1 Tax=Pseudoduganella violaceinigra TaxID=246602 RepID=UPI00041BEF7A|nr:TonB-dependent receptor [Pseudoduganella violaceinigra]
MKNQVPRALRLTAFAAASLTLANAGAADAADASLAGAVVVTGQRAVQAKSIAAQDKADNIVSVLSSDDIGNLPDKNAAEALARLPGVSVQRDQGEGRYVTVRGLGPDLNAVTINGALVPSPEAGRRAVALDVLPAGLIRSLEVTKTLTPAMDASSLGATVEVKSLSAFDLPGSLLSMNAAASHDQNTGRNSPSAGLLWASRFGGGKFGVAVGISAEKRKFGSENAETGGAWDGDRLSGFEMRDYLPVRARRAAALNLDYRPQAGNAWFLRSFLSRFSDDEVRDRMTVSNASGGALWEGVPASARLERRLRQRKFTQEIESLVLGTQQTLGDWKLDVQAGRSKADEDTPEALNDGRFRGNANFKDISFTNSERPALQAPPAAYDPGSYSLNAITLQQRYSKDTERHLKFDLGHEFGLGELRSAVKFGAKASRREKTNDTNQWSYAAKAVPGSLSMASFVQGHQLDYPFAPIGAALDPTAIRARVAGLARDPARLASESAINDFTLNEDINSAYFQDTLSHGDWRLLAGVRAERTDFDAAGVRASGGTITPLQRGRSYTNWLPSLQLRYDLDRETSLRGAWTNSVVRANFSQLAPGVALASATEATIGNPDLNPLKSHNFDLGVERVIGSDGAVSAYLFYKDIKDFTYTTNLAGSGQWAGFTTATTYANGDRAKVKGIELSWQQPLRMLPAPFNGLLVGANGALTDSRAGVARFDNKAGAMVSRRISMPGQSDRVMNLSIGYEAGPLSTRIAVNYKSPYLLELGSDILNPAQDRIVDTQKQVDFSLGWQFSKGIQLTFDIGNLNNEKYYVYQGVKRHNAQYEQYGRTYKLALKASVF